MDHLGGHPVGVPHHRVSLPAVGPLQAGELPLRLRQLLLVLVVHHETRQPKVGHHHCAVLHAQTHTHRKSVTNLHCDAGRA